MSERSRQALTLYRAARVDDQLDYYGRTSAEYDRAGAQSVALAAYDLVFGFERVSKLYADAIRSLHRIEEPDLAGIDDEAAAAEQVASYAGAVEAVLRKEQAQWGQLTAEIEIPGQGEQP